MLCNKPTTLLSFTKESYSSFYSLQLFGDKKYVSSGFEEYEEKLYRKYINRNRKIIVIGCSAGRECIEFAKAGYQVVGIDYNEELINLANMWTRKLNLKIEYLVKDICSYTPETDFDYMTFSIYPLIPTKNIRIVILKRLSNFLKKDGIIFIYFQSRGENLRLQNKFIMFILKVINRDYEYGDYVHGLCYVHHFTEKELKEEVKEAGFKVLATSYGKPDAPYAVAALSPIRKI